MVKFLIFQILAFFFLSLTSTAEAQSVDLQTMLNEAGQSSPAIIKSQAAYDEASWKKVESYQGYLPSLTGSLNYLTSRRYLLTDISLGGIPTSIPQIIPTTIYTLAATVPLFDGFASTNRLLASKKAENSARYDLEWTQFQSSRQVALQFYKALAAQQLKEVSEQNLKSLNDHLRDIQALKKAGVSTSYDVLRVDVQVSEAKAEVLNTSDSYELSKFKLGELLGKDQETRELSGQLPNLSQHALAPLKTLQVTERADILALKEKSDSLRDLDAASGRYWVPKISAYGQYQYYNNRNDKFSDDAAFREAYQVGLNLTWNLFDIAAIAKSHQSSAQALQLDKNLQIARLKAAQDLEYWKRKFNYFKTVSASRVVDIEKSTEAIRLAKEGRRAGTRTTTELLDTELDLFRSRAGLVNAQIGAIEALINLELATGRQLYDFK